MHQVRRTPPLLGVKNKYYHSLNIKLFNKKKIITIYQNVFFNFSAFCSKQKELKVKNAVIEANAN